MWFYYRVRQNDKQFRACVVGLCDGTGKLPESGRPAAFAYSRTRACCACSRCGTDGLYLYLRYTKYIGGI